MLIWWLYVCMLIQICLFSNIRRFVYQPKLSRLSRSPSIRHVVFQDNLKLVMGNILYLCILICFRAVEGKETSQTILQMKDPFKLSFWLVAYGYQVTLQTSESAFRNNYLQRWTGSIWARVQEYPTVSKKILDPFLVDPIKAFLESQIRLIQTSIVVFYILVLDRIKDFTLCYHLLRRIAIGRFGDREGSPHSVDSISEYRIFGLGDSAAAVRPRGMGDGDWGSAVVKKILGIYLSRCGP